MSRGYLDLKEGQILVIEGRSPLELKVLSVKKEELRLSTPQGIVDIQKGRFVMIRRLGIFNYGSRGHGKRSHIRLQMPDDYSYHVYNVKIGVKK